MENNLKVLLVEDDPLFIKMVERMLLKEPKMELVFAQNLEMGLKVPGENRIDAVLLDLGLPDSYGLETLHRFSSQFPDIPVIVLTGIDDEVLAMDALKVGAQDYLMKGEIRRNLLIRSMRYSIERNRIEGDLKHARNELEAKVIERTSELRLANERLQVELEERLTLEKIWRRYDFIVNTSKELMTFVDRTYRYEAVNDAYCQAHNLPRNEILGKEVAEIWGREHFNRVIKSNFDNCFMGKTVNYQGHFNFGALGLVFVDVTYYPYYAVSGEISHAVVVTRDITAQKNAEEKLRKYAEKLRGLTWKLVNAQEEERQRLSRELHDEAGQALTALKISLELIYPDLPKNLDDVRTRVQEAIQLTGVTMERIRSLAHTLRPPALDALGLNRTIGDYCRSFARKTGLEIKYQGQVLPKLPEEIQISFYRFLQEALTNIAKHAEAKNVSVELSYDQQVVSLFIEDDGRGFETSDYLDKGNGIGLMGMKERIDLLGGRMDFQSTPGEGTLLVARVPYHQ